MPLRRLVAGLVSASALVPALAAAQGTVSSQGLGYPTGQLSTRALGMGGAAAELDPSTPLNPAAIASAGVTTLFLHYAPESREVTLGDQKASSSLSRFPVFGAILAASRRGYVSLTSSALLDRSWATVSADEADSVGVVESYQVRGGITDLRLAGAWAFGQRFQAGAGVHVLTGSNRLTVSRIDRDNVDADFEQTTELTYTGTAASAGLVWSPSRLVSLGASGQVGGTARAKISDSTIASATAPARFGASLSYTGISGLVLAARADWHGWSSLQGLGRGDFDPQDTWTYGFGADVVGPSAFGRSVNLRAGAAWRELPFAALGETPREKALSAGLGVPFARNRVIVDGVVQRASRTAGAATETAWTYGLGLTIRP